MDSGAVGRGEINPSHFNLPSARESPKRCRTRPATGHCILPLLAVKRGPAYRSTVERSRSGGSPGVCGRRRVDHEQPFCPASPGAGTRPAFPARGDGPQVAPCAISVRLAGPPEACSRSCVTCLISSISVSVAGVCVEGVESGLDEVPVVANDPVDRVRTLTIEQHLKSPIRRVDVPHARGLRFDRLARYGVARLPGAAHEFGQCVVRFGDLRLQTPNTPVDISDFLVYL